MENNSTVQIINGASGEGINPSKENPLRQNKIYKVTYIDLRESETVIENVSARLLNRMQWDKDTEILVIEKLKEGITEKQFKFITKILKSKYIGDALANKLLDINVHNLTKQEASNYINNLINQVELRKSQQEFHKDYWEGR